ncbi:hypothetical protein [Alkaliphilus metalliredigens]|uniref:hypothetical protein n=1 Tax=Alkaliphilus metalliredigens TaxID=208226 RepID=UPI0002D70FD9|nr:hypothetical protein [Alkaliphilus metalliredigens]
MNRCGNCGVMLDKSMTACPLCHTKIRDIQLSPGQKLYPVYDTSKPKFKKRGILNLPAFFREWKPIMHI